MPDDTVHLLVNGTDWQGWESLVVERSCEDCPSRFTLTVTERFPDAGQIDIQPFQSCQVKIGTDLVITGYVDRYRSRLGPTEHEISIIGRGRVEDMVDCSALIDGMQISGTALSVIQQLAQPFGVTVSALPGTVNADKAIPQFNVIPTETPYEVAERIARYAQLLVYEDVDGNLVLAQAGADQMASGFQEGINAEAAEVSFSGDEQFSLYRALVMSFDKSSDVGTGGNTIANVTDSTVPRYRPRAIISEQGVNGIDLAAQRAQWEKARRFGRSQAVTVQCDSWRDSSGALWRPNALASVNFPSLKLTPPQPWLIGGVRFMRNLERGSIAEVTLMPKEAFSPEPNYLFPFDWQVSQELNNNGTQPPGPTDPPLPPDQTIT